MTAVNPILQIQALSFSYGDRKALDEVSLQVKEGTIFALLGPNGGGKSTLFRILSTLVSPEKNRVSLFGYDVATQASLVRSKLGVVFQNPSIDKKLTVSENLMHQGHLYGLGGSKLKSRISEILQSFQLEDRSNDFVETLSGGLQRRVEIAKALLHEPKLLLMDEPSTGLDPRARLDLWSLLQGLRSSQGITIFFTTHILEEAENCDEIAILHKGKRVAMDSPQNLKKLIEGDVIAVETKTPTELAAKIDQKFKAHVRVVNGGLRIEKAEGHRFLSELMEAFPDQIQGIKLHKPNLDDVFLQMTGDRFDDV